VFWGALNGCYLILEAIVFKRRRDGIFNIVFTFILINFAWIFFRANSITEALYIIKKIGTSPGKLYIGSGDDITASIYAVLAIAIVLSVEIKKEFFNSLWSVSQNKVELIRLTGYAVIIYLIIYLGVFGDSQFIYFQF